MSDNKGDQNKKKYDIKLQKVFLYGYFPLSYYLMELKNQIKIL